MSRRHLTLSCAGETLVGTLDDAPGSTGLLIVSGGNELRSGAWSGMAQLAARLAANGYPVFRFDRRGVGDSTGENTGFEGSADDLAAAASAFRAACPHLTTLIALGNCDAAAALMLHYRSVNASDLLLANPWTFDPPASGNPQDISHSPAEIRRRYISKLTSVAGWKQLLSGGVNLKKVRQGLNKAASSSSSQLAKLLEQSLASYSGKVVFLLAENDRTARGFLENWPAGDRRIRSCPTASHSFSDDAARDWLFDEISEALNRP